MKLHIRTFALKCPHVGIEPATSTYAAQTITQLSKSAGDAETTTAYAARKFLRASSRTGPGENSYNRNNKKIENKNHYRKIPKIEKENH